MHCVSASIVGIGQVSTSQTDISQVVHKPCSGPSIDDESDTNWLHINPTYKRQTRVVEDIRNMSVTPTDVLVQECFDPISYISGRTIQMIGMHAHHFQYQLKIPF